jgi:hypothetical protein
MDGLPSTFPHINQHFQRMSNVLFGKRQQRFRLIRTVRERLILVCQPLSDSLPDVAGKSQVFLLVGT